MKPLASLARLSSVTSIIFATLAPSSLRQSPAAAQVPAFRSGVSVVSVDVSVKNSKAMVEHLTSGDFALTDNGQPQQIEAVTIEAVPVDVTLVMDTSGSTVTAIGRVASDVQHIAAILRPADRMRLITCSNGVQEVLPMQTPSSHPPLDHLRAGGGTSLNDAVLYALTWPSSVDRRHLIVVLTDGEDTSSALEDDTIPELASRADAMLHAVLFTSSVGAPHTPLRSRAALMSAADRTGGEVHQLNDAVAAFQSIFNNFRRSYVLRYTPTGVQIEGWHELSVRVTKRGSERFVVHARKGYFGG